MKIAVLRHDSDVVGAGAALAAELQLPHIEQTEEEHGFAFSLSYVHSKLTLRREQAKAGEKFAVDFGDPKLQYRASSGVKNQNIAKAIGIKGSFRPSVLDATAGLGKDAYLLASLGCRVTLLERSPIVHALLADGIARGREQGGETQRVLENMHLQQGDFLELGELSTRVDVVYLDPMFPQRRKSAKVKKEMALLQHLLGHQDDGASMLEHAQQFAHKRVVVKRAKLSEQLGSRKPDISFKGSSSRYDVYLAG